MSIVSNIHTATIYEPKTSKPFTGQRLVKTIAKADKDGNYGQHLQQTMCTSVPQLLGDEVVDALNDDVIQVALLPHFVAYLETVQNSLIGDKIKSGVKIVTTEELSIKALIDYLDSDSVGEKWNSARIAVWFNSNVAESFATRLMEKGINDTDLDVKLAVTSKRFSEALGSKTKIHPKVAEKLLAVLELMDDKSGTIYKRFSARLTPIVTEDCMDFGF